MRMPSSIQACFGVFADNKLEAAIIFAFPAARWRERVLELSRLVRLPDCVMPLTGLIALACNHLRRDGWDLLISYADQEQSHHGGIYQAAGWNYDSFRKPCQPGLMINGEYVHGRTCNHRWKTRSAAKLRLILPDADIAPYYDKDRYLYWRALSVSGKTKAKRLGLKKLEYFKPNAARSLDAPMPNGVSEAQPLGAAPN